MKPRSFSQEAREDNLSGDIHCRIYSIRRLQLTKKHWTGMQLCSPFWRLYAHFGEGASLETAGGEFILKPRRIYLVPAGLAFKTHLDVLEVDQLYSHFELIGLSLDMVRMNFGSVFELPESPLSISFFDKDWINFKGDRAPTVAEVSRMKAMIRYGLADWIEGFCDHTQERLNNYLQSHTRVRPIIEYIEDNISSSLSNQELAKLCHVGEDHFIRLFRTWTHQTPAQFILDVRVKHASEELTLTEKSIETIAADCGFSDRFHLSRVFKERIGQSPAKYRRNQMLEG